MTSPERLSPRLYLNGFPKAGLHALVQGFIPVLAPFMVQNWLGSFLDSSFTENRVDDELIAATFRAQHPGTYIMGHMEHTPAIQAHMERARVVQVFIIRDLRDVIVSQYHHVMTEDDGRFAHPDKDAYRAIGDREGVCMAIMEGLDNLSSVSARWQLYEDWLDVPWTLTIRYEDLIADPAAVLGLAVKHVFGYEATRGGYQLHLSQSTYDDLVSQMVESMHRRDLKGTFRKGVPGEWKEQFTPKLARLFERMSGDWLQRFGYETDREWINQLENVKTGGEYATVRG